MKLPLYIDWIVEFFTAIAVIIITACAMSVAFALYRKDREINLYRYLLIQSISLFVFASGRATGHILKRILLIYGYSGIWKKLSPVSGSINTLTITVFALVALFYGDFRRINYMLNALKKEKERFRRLFNYKQAIFDSMMHPALVISNDFTIIDANRTFLEHYDFKEGDVIGKKCFEISHGYSVPCETKGEPCPLKVVLETAKGYTIRHNHKKGSEQRITEIYATPLKDEKGEPEGIIEIAKDITEEVMAEREKMQMAEEIFEMRKHMALRTAIGGIAHEFNNLLAAILGNAELIIMKLGEEFSENKRLLTIKKSAERASDLIRKMMIYEKADFFTREPVMVNQFIEAILPELKSYLTEHISLVCTLEPSVTQILVDPESLKQAIKNLFQNAIDAMKDRGGQLTIHTYTRTVNDNTYNCIEIKDTGSGISPENLSRIFDPFFTTKDIGEGEGLGLSVVKGIVDANQGFIEVDSREGEGSSFHICFPCISK